MPKAPGEIDEIRLHRHRDWVCFDFELLGTTLLSPGLARKFATSLTKFADDCDACRFSESNLVVESIKKESHDPPTSA